MTVKVIYKVEFSGNRILFVEEIDHAALREEAGPDGWYRVVEEMYTGVQPEPEAGE